MKPLTFYVASWILLLTYFTSFASAHVRLEFPKARDLPFDFLDNVRTVAPCGVPKGNWSTSIESGGSLDITWHLGYPHQGKNTQKII
jgi:hypothetical protein